MYGSKSITADQTTASATFVAVPGLALKFTVEEDEMWCLLKLKAVVSNATVDARCDLDLKVDTVLQGGAAGLTGATSSTANAMVPVHLEHVVRLTKGQHVVAAQFKASAGTAAVNAATFAAKLEVLRLSNNAVLAHGVDAKFQVTE